jgi:DNA-binding CsgD family transcriptional regulator
MKRDALDMIELGYDLTGSTAEWLGRLAPAIYERFGAGLGMHSFVYDLTKEHRIRVGERQGVDAPPGSMDQVASAMQQMPLDFVRHSFMRCEATTQSQADPIAREHVRPVMAMLEAALGWRDLLIVGGLDPSEQGVYFGVALPEQTKLPARVVREWTRVAVHLAAAYRLRRRLGGGVLKVDSADAVLTPHGRVEHAQDEAQASTAREELKKAVKDLERARGRLRRSDPERAVDMWTGLTSGRWSLVDQFDTDGRRYVLARRNDVAVEGLDALTPRERQVTAYAALGHTNKLIAYDVGLADSTVRVLLHRAAKKLGATTRRELTACYLARAEAAPLRP